MVDSKGSNGKSPRRWTYYDYKILQFQLTDAYEAVFCDNLHEGGELKFRAEKIDGLALAAVAAHDVESVPNSRPKELQVHRYRSIVGIMLYTDEGFRVVNECSNFIGLIPKGEAADSTIAELDYEYYCRLSDETRQKHRIAQ